MTVEVGHVSMAGDWLSADEPDILRQKYSDKEREKIPLEDFGDPGHRAFPIVEAEDVIHAAERLGEASGDKAAIKQRIKAIAHRKGFPLPKTWQEEESKRGDGMGDEVKRLPLYMPIVRYDETNWTVTGQATMEAVDAYGTEFDYSASKRAFSQWAGNVREMHDSKKAVGRAIDVQFDDENKAVFVTARVSRGAKDTWEKIKDGTLRGYSVGALAGKEDWEMVQRDGQEVPRLTNYRLVELSLVDNPATPGCDIEIVRADGFGNGDVLMPDEEIDAISQATDTRAGARVSHVMQDTLHSMRDSALQQVIQLLKTCDCEECQNGLAAIDPDNDGDIDCLGGIGDYDDDGGKSDMLAGYRSLEPAIQRAIAPTVTRFEAMLSQWAGIKPQQIQPPTIDTSKIEDRLQRLESAIAGIAEVVPQIGELKELTRAIAEQPVGGGPIANGAAMDKVLATRGIPTSPPELDIAAIVRAAQGGQLSQDDQLKYATRMIKQERGM